jgi:DnaJ family protein C protein 17
VRRAYKQRALETHPDKLDPVLSEEDKHAAEARFHQVILFVFSATSFASYVR